MAYNPPETKREIRDTLFCLGVEKTEARYDTPKGHVWSFYLPETKSDIDIYSPSFMRYKKKVYKSTYELKLALISDFRFKI